jgi:hypothetical protein
VALGEELREREAVGVVLDDEGNGEPGPEQADESRLLVKRRVGGAVHDVGRGAVGAGRAQADGLVRETAGRLRDELQDVGDDALPAEAGLGRPALADPYLACPVDEAGFDLRPAQVDPDGVSAHTSAPATFYAQWGSEATSGAGTVSGVSPLCSLIPLVY